MVRNNLNNKTNEYNANNAWYLSSSGDFDNNNNKDNTYGIVPVQVKLKINKFTFNDLVEAYFSCSKHKKKCAPFVLFDIDFINNLTQLLNELNTDTYEVQRFSYINITEPKPREIWMSNFRDRIVHHLIYQYLEPILNRSFIDTTYACIPGRGILQASKDVERVIKMIAPTKLDKLNTYYLKLDIKNYFCSIDKSILWSQILNYVEEGTLLASIIKKIVFADITKDVKQPKKIRFPQKSLWLVEKNKGLPIGNLTSQFFSNIYLNGLDHYAKDVLKVNYFRYVDDVLVIDIDKNKILEVGNLLDTWLKTNRNLSFNKEKTKLNRVYNGVDFVGVVIKPYGTLIRKRTCSKAIKAAKNLKYTLDVSSLNSYLGLMKHHKTHTIRQKLCKIAQIPYLIHSDKNFYKVVKH